MITTSMDRWHFTAVLTGGSSARKKSHLAEIESKLPRPSGDSGPRVVDLSGKIDLLTLAALIAQARSIGDSRFRTDASGRRIGTPQVVLFGPTNPFHWRPRQPSALDITGRIASSGSRFRPRQERFPMKLISTQAVINAMDSLLSTPSAIARYERARRPKAA